MKRVILLAVVVLMATMSALAQIPANVKEVMKKSSSQWTIRQDWCSTLY